MKRGEHGCRGGGRNFRREYGCGEGPCNDNELKYNNSCRHDEGNQGGQEKGQGIGAGNRGDKGGRNGTVFGCSD